MIIPKLPVVHLDTTLADLYRENGIHGSFIVTMYCVFGHLDLHANFPRELTWPEDEEPVPYSDDPSEQDRLRKVILGLKPLRRAWGLGNMEVLFFGPNITAKGVKTALSQLHPTQRHIPRFVDLNKGPVSEQLRGMTTMTTTGAASGAERQNKQLLFWRPQGWMKEHDCLLDPQEAYDINSKKYLLTSGMRTPPSTITDLQTTDLSPTSSSSSLFHTRPVPFVVKLCRAGCGFGTYLVRSEPERAATLTALATYRRRGVGEVLVTDYVDLAEDLAVHFVVGAPGTAHDRDNPLILGVTVQTLTAGGKWTGGHIDYSAQARLADYVRATLRDTARKLPASFVGWAGIDIVVDRHGGGQFVVDLNARFTGSMPICFMAGHFWERRGLPLAQFAAFEYKAGHADEIYERLYPLVQSGRVVVTATATIDESDCDNDSSSHMADIVWGGRDQGDLARVEREIRDSLGEKPRAQLPEVAE
ncbi:ATP-grasp domain-containing protein [Apiospora phragmitis]|uniref:ATP-grasp domain-containing protein n=1 Tax=Apiospora phragmitis TaxID=2905665 RepID=A0ABR1TVC9_9PEZI